MENQPYSGKSGDFLLTSYDANNLALDITSGISGVHIKPSEITDIEFSLDNIHANATSNLTLSFKIDNELKNGDKLHIKFPVQNLKWSTEVHIDNSYFATSRYCCNASNGSFVINQRVEGGQTLNVIFSYVVNPRVSLDDFVRKHEHESAGRTMGHNVTILKLFTTREIGGNVVTVDTARQFPTLMTSVGTPSMASLYKKGTNVSVGAMDTRGASVDVIISGNYIGLSESTYQTAIIHLQHRWGNRPVVTSGQCTASSPKRVNCSNGAGSGGGQNRRYRLRIKLDSGSYFYTFAGTDVITYERPSITSVATKNNLYLDTTFDEITLTGENFASYDYPVSLRFGPVSHPNIYSIGETDCWVSLEHTQIKCNASNIIPNTGLNRTNLRFNVSLAGLHNSKVTNLSFHRPSLKVAFSKINYRSCSPNANLSPSFELCKSFAQMLSREF